MSEGHQSFKLAVGAVITVPEGVILLTPRLKELTPETPAAMPRFTRLAPVKGGEFRFTRSTSRYGKVLFLSEGILPGDKLEIQWVDAKCACATKVQS